MALKVKHWQRTLDVMGRALLLCAQRAVPLMEGRWGRIVAITSPGQPPQVTLAAPTTGQIFTTASVVPLSATSTSPPADIQRVEFIAGNDVE